MELLPALDLRHGRVVRLLRGDPGRETVYGEDPEAVLAAYAAAGVARAHLVDLDAALGEPPQRALVERLAGLAAGRRPDLQLGGGLRDAGAVGWALAAGCDRAVLGSLVVRDPAAFAALARRFPGRLVPALDVRDGEVRTAGWREGSGVAPEAAAAALAGLPCPAVLVTDVARDGALTGPDLELARRVAAAAGLPALVSGGVRTLADLTAARGTPGVAGVVVGRALYEGAFGLGEALAACRGEVVPA
jgi:phosphoribosylformimino-5-aminoimidazole carboxamide ribotide isomerase